MMHEGYKKKGQSRMNNMEGCGTRGGKNFEGKLRPLMIWGSPHHIWGVWGGLGEGVNHAVVPCRRAMLQ